ncbi:MULTISPECIES: hypothetical protein [Amycolatopsis]|uniref:hypothetical protein n=1 Tax=Amycolatopsis TaxID=1813 RepID=UPI000F7ABA20|nr:hypothetical protein [Amycolatopsis sp. WAC 04197]RSN49327.1 hypothetical protein DMC64_01725 [Amycolatopsis sp. WAC 04197]
MRRTWGFLTVGLLFLATACSIEIEIPIRSKTTPSSSFKAATPTTFKAATPTTPIPVSPATVTDACPFIAVGELAQIIGTSAEIRAQEQPADVEGTEKRYSCLYEDIHQSPDGAPRLHITVAPEIGAESVTAVDNTMKAFCREPITTVGGVGDKTAHCEQDKDFTRAIVVVGKRSNGQVRLALVDLPKNRADVYEAIAKLLAERL